MRKMLVERAGDPASARPVILGFGDGGECFRNLLSNWFGHLHRLGIREYIFFPLDKGLYRDLHAKGEPAVWLSQPRLQGTSGTIGHYHTASWNTVTYGRILAVLSVIEFGYDVIYADLDIALVRDPRNFLLGHRHAVWLTASSPPAQSCHFLFSRGFPAPKVNTGFFMVRASTEAARFLRSWSELDYLSTVFHYQEALNTCLIAKSCRLWAVNASSKPLRRKALPLTGFVQAQTLTYAPFLECRRGADRLNVCILPADLFPNRLSQQQTGCAGCYTAHATNLLGGHQKQKWLMHTHVQTAAGVPPVPLWSAAANQTMCAEHAPTAYAAVPPAAKKPSHVARC